MASPAEMTIVNGRLAVAPNESVTVAVNVNVPAVFGVPARTPPAEKTNPGGRPLPTAQLYGPTPPEAASDCE